MMRKLEFTPGGYLWQLDYRDTIRLLQEKLVMFVRLNGKLRNNIINKTQFFNNTVESIEINLMEFSEAYRSKFIDGDMDEYCLKFMELLRPVLIDFVKEIGFDAYAFRFRFRYGKKVFEKQKNILIPIENID